MQFAPLTRTFTLATAKYFLWFFIFENMIDLGLWHYDEEKTQRYLENKSVFDLLYDFFLPFFLSSFMVFKYLYKKFAVENLSYIFRKLVKFWIFVTAISAIWYYFAGNLEIGKLFLPEFLEKIFS